MTIQEAKLILHAYRPSGEDSADPFFSKALELARTNPELGAWFAEQQKFDAAMGQALQSQLPPADLKARILSQQILPTAPKRLSFSSFKLLAPLAAAVVFFAGLFTLHESSFFFVGGHAMTLTAFASQALTIKEQGVALGMKSTDPEQLRKWLAERGAPASFVIPPGLRGVPSAGCQSYTINGTKVSLVCFNLGDNRIAHLFIVDKTALADAAPDAHLQLREQDGIALASWSGEGKSYVLTGDNISMEILKRLV